MPSEMNISGLTNELRAQVDATLSRKLSNIDKEIDRCISDMLRSIVMAAMGLRDAFGRIELDNNRNTALRQHIESIADTRARKWLSNFDWADHSERLNAQLALSVRRAYEKMLKEALDKQLKAAVDAEVAKRIDALVQTMLQTSDIQVLTEEAQHLEFEQYQRLREKYGGHFQSHSIKTPTDLTFEENRLVDRTEAEHLFGLERSELEKEERRISKLSSEPKKKKA